jgi:hypothetical protein
MMYDVGYRISLILTHCQLFQSLELWKSSKHPIIFQIPPNPRPDDYSVRKLFTGLATAALMA